MNRNFFPFFLMCAINLFKNVPSLLGTPIIAGMPDSKYIFKYHAAILENNWLTKKLKLFCSGSIIGEKYILTAANCFLKKENNDVHVLFTLAHGNIVVVAGTNRLSENGIKREIIKVLIPHDYKTKPRRIADIAVAELNQNLDVAQNPVKLQILPLWPYLAHDSETNQLAAFSGFGLYTLAISDTTSDINRFLNVKILRPEHNEPTLFAKSMNPGSTSCFGDIGAGLAYQGHLIGVLVRGPPNCIPDLMALTFTRIPNFLNFIERAKNEHGEHGDMYVLK